ncbi:MFS transporter [Sphingosinicella rhizophila]|uniref:MFS transporter n=1 Tax=Sphingosinicella rhizophila TaxID=3050082 RepID=A0ABU3Q5Q6_9SPHN|nr:MFS transporter [Sphingosinicella sp. GR2756]MDT9598741.1 MFS transporter [Sphingosinicella sp. GR2756]
MSTILTGAEAEMPVPAPEVGPRPSPRAWYALAILIVAMLFGFVNGRILLLLAEFIKQDLSLSDFQIGETHGVAPALFGMLFAYPVAWLADRFERRTVLALSVIFWSIATAATGLAWDFPTLLFCSVAIIIGEVGLFPIIWSLISDLFPKKWQPRAFIIFYACQVLGGGLATALGGASIGAIEGLRPLLPTSIQELEAWRLVFFFVALPGPLVALGIFAIGRTKRTVTAAQGPKAMAPIRPYLREHGLVMFGTYATVGLFQFAVIGMGTWTVISVIRAFKVDAATVGVSYGTYFMAGAAIGLVLAMILTPVWRRLAGTAFALRAISYAAILLILPALLLPFTTAIWQAYALVFILPIIFVPAASLMPSMMVDIVPAPVRTRAASIGSLFLFSQAIASPLIGYVSDQMVGVERGLMWAMAMVGVPAYVACFLLARFMESRYRRTVAIVEAESKNCVQSNLP